MDIDILVDVINDTAGENERIESEFVDMTELEIARNQILGSAKPQIQVTTVDDIKGDDFKKKAMDAYIEAKKEGKRIEFDRRVRAQDFKNSIRNGVGNVRIDETLSRRPNKKR